MSDTDMFEIADNDEARAAYNEMKLLQGSFEKEKKGRIPAAFEFWRAGKMSATTLPPGEDQTSNAAAKLESSQQPRLLQPGTGWQNPLLSTVQLTCFNDSTCEPKRRRRTDLIERYVCCCVFGSLHNVHTERGRARMKKAVWACPSAPEKCSVHFFISVRLSFC